ncbi:MAG: methyltransferase [Oscillospiraceae bacterium]|jgi:tRNA1(Val) A37 N6-methylase TrmN6|nr:methyltransferase [Oscillospiraceae bacterium]
MQEIFDIYGYKLYISKDCRFGTDAVVLADFAAPKQNDDVVELCAGCGAVSFFMLKKYAPKHIDAIDISAEAIALLSQSVADNSLGGRITPIAADLRELNGVLPRERFDKVVVNPPYYKKNGGKVATARDRYARQELTCDIADVANAASYLLKFGGTLKLCHTPERLAEVTAALQARGLEPKKLVFLMNGESGKPWLFLMSAKRGAKPGLIVNVEQTPRLGGLFGDR